MLADSAFHVDGSAGSPHEPAVNVHTLCFPHHCIALPLKRWAWSPPLPSTSSLENPFSKTANGFLGRISDLADTTHSHRYSFVLVAAPPKHHSRCLLLPSRLHRRRLSYHQRLRLQGRLQRRLTLPVQFRLGQTTMSKRPPPRNAGLECHRMTPREQLV